MTDETAIYLAKALNRFSDVIDGLYDSEYGAIAQLEQQRIILTDALEDFKFNMNRHTEALTTRLPRL